MNKRALSLVLTLGVLAAPLALTGCGEEKKPEAPKPTAPAAAPAAPADKPK